MVSPVASEIVGYELPMGDLLCRPCAVAHGVGTPKTADALEPGDTWLCSACARIIAEAPAPGRIRRVFTAAGDVRYEPSRPCPRHPAYNDDYCPRCGTVATIPQV